MELHILEIFSSAAIHRTIVGCYLTWFIRILKNSHNYIPWFVSNILDTILFKTRLFSSRNCKNWCTIMFLYIPLILFLIWINTSYTIIYLYILFYTIISHNIPLCTIIFHCRQLSIISFLQCSTVQSIHLLFGNQYTLFYRAICPPCLFQLPPHYLFWEADVKYWVSPVNYIIKATFSFFPHPQGFLLYSSTQNVRF